MLKEEFNVYQQNFVETIEHNKTAREVAEQMLSLKVMVAQTEINSDLKTQRNIINTGKEPQAAEIDDKQLINCYDRLELHA